MTAISENKFDFKKLFNIAGWYSSVSAAPLAFYRISFGLLMLFSTIRFMLNGWVHAQYISPTFHFTYYGFEWLPYPSEFGVYALFTTMLVTSLLICLGLFYRFATILFFFSFTYVELLDKANYLNHYYFVNLIAFLLIFIPANRHFSLDAKLGIAKPSHTCAKWNIGILQFQIAIVYIFAGIAKLGSDWLLDAQPLKYWLHTANHLEFFGPLLKQDWVAYVFAWFGCIYDLTIVLFLLMPKTRKIAYVFVVIFHLTTWLLFPIGVFPWVMMVATFIFFSPNFHEAILNRIRRIFSLSKPVEISNFFKPQRRLITFMLSAYILFQITFPFRYLIYDGNLFWTEQGYRFSWRVMLMEKTGYATFYINQNGKEIEINNSDYLTANQEKMMSTQPDMILQFAHYLESAFHDTIIIRHGVEMKFNSPSVHAEVYVTLNSRPHQLFVDKKHNLTQIENNLTARDWLEPFQE